MHGRLAATLLVAMVAGLMGGCGGGSDALAERCEEFERRDGLPADMLEEAVRDCVEDTKRGEPQVYNWTMRRAFAAAVEPVLMRQAEAVVPDDPPDEIGGVACQVVIDPNCSVELVWDDAPPLSVKYEVTLDGACWTATPASLTLWEQGPGPVDNGARGSVEPIPSELSEPLSDCLEGDLLP